MNYKRYLKILLIIIWIIVIFLFSNQNAKKSLELSKGVTYKVVEVVKGKDYPEEKKQSLVKELVAFIRKCAHFFLYFVLAIFVFILLNEFIPINKKIILFTILCCLIYAITDELHQGFINGRSARIFDVFVDTCGSTLSTCIMYTIYKIKLNNK